MKRLFVLAMAAMFAVACGEKQLTVEEQMAQYQDRINASLEALDKMEFMQERDVMKWFGGLNETDQNLAMKMCADIEATRKEMIEWQKTLTEEDKLKLREFGKTLVTGEEHFRKMMQVNQINKMVNRRPIPKKVK
jgi:flavin-dependent dehydrogenase